jgi:hypothetical protein
MYAQCCRGKPRSTQRRMTLPRQAGRRGSRTSRIGAERTECRCDAQTNPETGSSHLPMTSDRNSPWADERTDSLNGGHSRFAPEWPMLSAATDWFANLCPRKQ